MRYFLIVILLYALFFLIVRHAAPEWEGTTGYYAGLFICSLIAMVITWRDTPGWFDKVLLGVMKYGVLSAGIIFFIWGVGYKLAFWGQSNSDAVFVSAGDVILANLALVTGVVIAGWGYMRYFRR